MKKLIVFATIGLISAVGVFTGVFYWVLSHNAKQSPDKPTAAQQQVQKQQPAVPQPDAVPPPANFVYYNAWPGDHDNPLFKNYQMSPQKPMTLYTFKDTASQQVAIIPPGEMVTLITADFHANPSVSPIEVLKEQSGLKQGSIIYLISYIGRGECLVWYKNNVITVPAQGIEGLQFSKEQKNDAPVWAKLTGLEASTPTLWLYVKTTGNKLGWIPLTSSQDWKHFGTSIYTAKK